MRRSPLFGQKENSNRKHAKCPKCKRCPCRSLQCGATTSKRLCKECKK